MSPALAGEFLSTEPPGKSLLCFLSSQLLLRFDFLIFQVEIISLVPSTVSLAHFRCSINVSFGALVVLCWQLTLARLWSSLINFNAFIQLTTSY